MTKEQMLIAATKAAYAALEVHAPGTAAAGMLARSLADYGVHAEGEEMQKAIKYHRDWLVANADPKGQRAEMRDEVRSTFRRAMELWPNAHLGDIARIDDLLSAKRYLRSRIGMGWSLREAVSDLQRDLDRYEDM